MGWTMKTMKRLETESPMIIPTPMASSALMIRLRSSTRCSKNDIAALGSSSGRGREAVSGDAAVAIDISLRFVFGLRSGFCGPFGRFRAVGRLVFGEIHAHQVRIVHRIAGLGVGASRVRILDWIRLAFRRR